MTYRELNDLFFKTWGDDKGIIRGKPVELIYRINTAPGVGGLDTDVDETLLQAELKRSGLVLNTESA